MKHRIASPVASVLLLGAVVVVFGLSGCPDGVDMEFDCETHDHCLDDEACLDEVCADEPREDQECPAAHEGEEYQGLRCVDGQWVTLPDAPTIEAVTAQPPTADPGGTIELNAEVTSEVEEQLSYRWEAPDGWELETDDEQTVELVAPDEYGRSATIEVDVVDPFEQTAEGEVATSTPEVGGPQIESVDVEPQPVSPGESQTLDAQSSHPDQQELTHEWTLPEGWDPVDGLDGAGPEVEAPDTHGTGGEVGLVVSDEAGNEATGSVFVSTIENPGPSIDTLEAQSPVLAPEGSTALTIETSHELDYAVEDYNWSTSAGDWSVETVDDQGSEAHVVAPDAFEDETEVTLEVVDAHGASDEATITVRTRPENPEPPVVEELYADDTPVDTDGSTLVHAAVDHDYEVQYDWSVAGDENWQIQAVSGNESTADLEAPDVHETPATVTVEVTDVYGESTQETLEVKTTTEENEQPVIDGMVVGETPLFPGETTKVTVYAHDPHGLDLTYDWSDPGTISPWDIDESTYAEPTEVEVVAPDQTDASVAVEVDVEDSEGMNKTGSAPIETVANEGPTITWISDPTAPIFPGETVILEVDANHPQGFGFDYVWELAEEDGWSVVSSSDQSTLALEAPDKTGEEAHVTPRVEDEYGGVASAEQRTVETVVNETPNVELSLETASPLEPGSSTTVTADASHDQGFAIENYDWEVVSDEGWTIDQRSSSPEEAVLEAPMVPDSTAEVRVDVSDEYGGETTGTENVATPENVDPHITGFNGATTPIAPGNSEVVDVEANHEFGFDLDYQWSVVDNGNWSLVGDTQSPGVEVQSPGEPVSRATLEVVVTDDFGGESTATVVVAEWSDPRAFGTCGAEGYRGPEDLGQCKDYYQGENSPLAEEVDGVEEFGHQIWEVPVTGYYEIDGVGANGGVQGAVDRARGAAAGGRFFLEAGEELWVQVGQRGLSGGTINDGAGASGGGASVAAVEFKELLVVAGGAGGRIVFDGSTDLQNSFGNGDSRGRGGYVGDELRAEGGEEGEGGRIDGDGIGAGGGLEGAGEASPYGGKSYFSDFMGAGGGEGEADIPGGFGSGGATALDDGRGFCGGGGGVGGGGGIGVEILADESCSGGGGGSKVVESDRLVDGTASTAPGEDVGGSYDDGRVFLNLVEVGE